MENVLIDPSTGGFDFRRRITGDGCRRRAQPPRSIYSSFVYAPPPPPFQYSPPYDLYSSLPLVLLPYSAYHPPPPAVSKYATVATLPYRPSPPRPPVATAAAKGKATVTGMTAAVPRKMAGECKRKKPPRAPRPTEEPPRTSQRRKPLERAAPLPPSPAVAEALDDLEREVARGFVEDLMHALAPAPSSLPLPTFSLVREAAATSCAV